MKMTHWILDSNGEPLEEPNVLKWTRWFESNDRHVALDTRKGVQISTVFLGLDHQYGDGAPLLYETMVFGGPHDEYCERYSTKEAALDGHKRALAMVERANDTVASFQEKKRVHGRQ